MDKEQAQEQLTYIQNILERSTQYTNLSPWSAISVGIAGLAAGAYSQWVLKGSLSYQEYIQGLAFCWSACFVVSIAVAVYFSHRRATRMSESLWVAPIKQAVEHFLVFIFIGGILTLAFSIYLLFWLIPSIWMLCYGGGIYIGSLYSLREVRFLGVFFLLCGTVALFFPVLNQLALMASFGAGHIVLGGIIFVKYSKK